MKTKEKIQNTKRIEMSEECMKNNKDFPYGQCCCNCRWHIGDYSHPLTDGKDVDKQRGWICLAPEMRGGFSEWSEHSLCEMWTAEEDREIEDNESCKMSEPRVTNEQLDIMRHAAGLDRSKTPYRNHYSFDEGYGSWDALQELVEMGLMEKEENPSSSNTLFYLTVQGCRMLGYRVPMF